MLTDNDEQRLIEHELEAALEFDPERWSDMLDEELRESTDEETRGWTALPDILDWQLTRLYTIGHFALAQLEVVMHIVHDTLETPGQVRGQHVELAAVLERGASDWTVLRLEPLPSR